MFGVLIDNNWPSMTQREKWVVFLWYSFYSVLTESEAYTNPAACPIEILMDFLMHNNYNKAPAFQYIGQNLHLDHTLI